VVVDGEELPISVQQLSSDSYFDGKR